MCVLALKITATTGSEDLGSTKELRGPKLCPAPEIRQGVISGGLAPAAYVAAGVGETVGPVAGSLREDGGLGDWDVVRVYLCRRPTFKQPVYYRWTKKNSCPECLFVVVA